MADNPIAKETEEVVVTPPTQPVTPPTDHSTGEDPQKMVPAIAVHQARQETKREKERAERLEQELREANNSKLPEDEQIERGFMELTSEKVMNSIDQDQFSKLPASIQNRIKTNPWAFVDEDSIKKETRFAETKQEYYKIVGRLATESISEILKDYVPGNPQQDKKPEDPSTPPNATEIKDPSGFTEAELLVMSMKDPEKFAEIRRSLQR